MHSQRQLENVVHVVGETVSRLDVLVVGVSRYEHVFLFIGLVRSIGIELVVGHDLVLVLVVVVEVVPARRAKRARTNALTAAQYETIAAAWLLMRARMAGPGWHGT
eukprot:1370865-Amphidinium_carterae.1